MPKLFSFILHSPKSGHWKQVMGEEVGEEGKDGGERARMRARVRMREWGAVSRARWTVKNNGVYPVGGC